MILSVVFATLVDDTEDELVSAERLRSVVALPCAVWSVPLEVQVEYF